MSIVQQDIPGARVVDLFAGSGALGLEALSRGAASATFVEIGARSIAALRRNVASLGADELCDVHKADGIRYAERLAPNAFDLGFADPPYRLGLAEQLARVWLTVPFARVLGIEHEKSVELPETEDRRVYGDSVISFYRTT